MTIDESIARLKQLKYEHGNVDVKIDAPNHDGYGENSFQTVGLEYNAEENIVEVF